MDGDDWVSVCELGILEFLTYLSAVSGMAGGLVLNTA